MNAYILGGQGKRGASFQIIPGQDKAYLFLINFATEDMNKTCLFSSREYTGDDRLN